jgi:protein involved in sex pheromone biosynthesis
LYVDIHHQGKRIGKELFERLLEDEKFKDCSSFYLRTLRDNIQSNHFYTKMWGKIFWETQQKMRKWPDVPMSWYYRQK